MHALYIVLSSVVVDVSLYYHSHCVYVLALQLGSTIHGLEHLVSSNVLRVLCDDARRDDAYDFTQVLYIYISIYVCMCAHAHLGCSVQIAWGLTLR